MKRITRLINAGPDKSTRVWLNQFGSWTKDEGHAFVFDDVDAEKRLRRLPHAALTDPPVTSPARPEV